MCTGTIARIDRSAIHDGPGIRTVVFFKGCPLRCAWCHSPDTQEAAPELAFLEERCIRCHTCMTSCPDGAISERNGRMRVDRDRCSICGECAAACPVLAREVIGHAAGVEDVVRAIEADRIFYEQSGGGVTFSGGEPLLQAPFLERLLQRCRERRITTAVETCGLAGTGALLAVARWTDLMLYDLKLLDDGRHRELTGGSNRQILDNLRALVSDHPRVRIRFPLVPGVNDDDSNVAALGEFAARLQIGELDVLPYHRAGLARYRRLDRECPLEDIQAPEPARVEAVMETLRGYGLDVQRGGCR